MELHKKKIDISLSSNFENLLASKKNSKAVLKGQEQAGTTNMLI